MASQSPIERLPLEILEEIFIYSANGNLPLASRRLNHNLAPNEAFFLRVGSSMLDSEDADIESNLLRRRFFTLDYFRGLLQDMCRYLPEHHQDIVFRDMVWQNAIFVEGVEIPNRLLHDFEITPLTSRTELPWKLELLEILKHYRVTFMNGTIIHQRYLGGVAGALLELVHARHVLGINSLLKLIPGTFFWPTSVPFHKHPASEMLKVLVIANNSLPYDTIFWALTTEFSMFTPQHEPGTLRRYFDNDLYTYIKARQVADLKTRFKMLNSVPRARCRELDWSGCWVGDWLAHLFRRFLHWSTWPPSGPRVPYEQFVAQKLDEKFPRVLPWCGMVKEGRGEGL